MPLTACRYAINGVRDHYCASLAHLLTSGDNRYHTLNGLTSHRGLMAHIFISYSKKNKEYAYQLADYLEANGFRIWIDRTEIEYGVDWWDAIVAGLRGCGAFIVVMTPESKDSQWVKREVFLAEQQRKPMFPLLLNGENWELFVLTQYIDRRDGSLPDDDFLNRLGRHVTRSRGCNPQPGSRPAATAVVPAYPRRPEIGRSSL